MEEIVKIDIKQQEDRFIADIGFCNRNKFLRLTETSIEKLMLKVQRRVINYTLNKHAKLEDLL